MQNCCKSTKIQQRRFDITVNSFLLNHVQLKISLKHVAGDQVIILDISLLLRNNQNRKLLIHFHTVIESSLTH